MRKRKAGQPHRGWKAAARQAKLHDRRAMDVPINSVVALAVVDDPYGVPGEKIEVTRSIRDDMLGFLFSRKDIDEAQMAAGRRYQRYAERAQIGNVRAIDPTREAVDGGFIPESSLTDAQIAATRELTEAARVLGRRAETIIRRVILHGDRFRDIAASGREGDVSHIRRTFLDGLEELAVFWGMASR